MAKKRKAGDGLIRQRADGRWEGRYVVGYDDHGYPKTKAVFGKSKRECAEKLAALKTQLGGIPSDKLRPEMRFADWLDYWYETHCKPNIRTSTQSGYEDRIRLHIKPELGEIPEEVRQLVPENIHLVYWDYFSRDRQSYERNIDAHNAIKSGSWFAGGLWTWAGFAPHNTFSIATMREAMKACHAKGVENVVMTMWGDNGAECSKFAVLPALFTVSQMAQDIDDVETIHANFEREFGIPFEDFRALDLIGTQNDSAEAIYNPEKYLLYCDPFMGQFDNRVKSGDAAGYADCAARLSRYESHAEYGYLFRSLRALCAFLSVKADLGIRTRAAYLSGDKKAAKALCTDYDAALERLDAFYAAYEQQWMHENKPQGFDVIDLRIGGQRQRLLHCRDRLLAYAEGRLDRIEELEEPVLDCCCEEKADGQATRAIFWHEIASANVI